MVGYDELADVYDWLVPEGLRAPEGAVAAFAAVISRLPAGGRVLDCAAGTGQLAVGLALRGFDVVAGDASPAMVERTRELASRRNAAVRTVVSTWEDLGGAVGGPFDAVFCVGNSLTHAAGVAGRRAALRQMATVLGEGGLLVLTSRNWERLRAARPGLEVDDRLVHRDGRSAVVVRAWTVPEPEGSVHAVEIAVAMLEREGAVRTVQERLTFWPFRHAQLQEDLRAAGLMLETTTYAADAERYMVIARPQAAPTCSC